MIARCVTHEVTNEVSDRNRLYEMAQQAHRQIGAEGLSPVADRGFFSGRFCAQ